MALLENKFRWNNIGWLAALAGMWGWTWLRLSVEWRASSQYEFGFLIPLLTLLMVWQRLGRFAATGDFQKGQPIPGGILVLAAGVFGLGELLAQHDPAWKIGPGLMMLSATILTVLWLKRIGGEQLVRQMLFPLAFNWLSLPWPSAVDQFIILKVKAWLSSITVDMLNWEGLAALREGSIIVLRDGVVGLDDACCGLQSFHAALMFSLFLGDFFRMPLVRRLAAVGCALALALAGNALRVWQLARIVGKRGEAASAQYHDTIGLAASLLIITGVFFTAWILARAGKIHKKEYAPASFSWIKAPLAGGDGLFLMSCLILVPFLCSGWFAIVEYRRPKPAAGPIWGLTTNRIERDWQLWPVQPTPAEARILGYSSASGWRFRSPEGWRGELLHFYWAPDRRQPSTAFAHTPNICFPAAGWEPVGAPSVIGLRLGGAFVEATLYRFRMGNFEQSALQVFHPRPFFGGPFALGGRLERFALLWKAPRQRVQEELLLFLDGALARETAAQRAGEVLGMMVEADQTEQTDQSDQGLVNPPRNALPVNK